MKAVLTREEVVATVCVVLRAERPGMTEEEINEIAREIWDRLCGT